VSVQTPLSPWLAAGLVVAILAGIKAVRRLSSSAAISSWSCAGAAGHGVLLADDDNNRPE
jgi:hypothetical protein